MSGKILTIAKMGDPILREVSTEVRAPSDRTIKTLIEDMEATVKYMNCSGLAAPQVFVPLQIVIFRILKTTTNPSYVLTPEYDPEGVPWTVMINPKVIPLTEEITVGWESCLSLPGLMGKVPRYHSIEYHFLTKSGKQEKRIAHGFHARVVQHECDHLKGILYPEKMTDMRTLSFKEEFLRSAA